ncbi:Cof-type HAD-IIB family hydrolase [Paenibacillus thailandensis]|uniref:Cof-type HAD-IIB family hydrolase n=1 Tax=Paenibacillus thailandensis TaxID=393250 RepID=A0ABW5QSU0_9BACL
MIKMIVSDLDGTLLDHSRRMNDRDRAAVAAAIQEGYELCIASGRMYSEIRIVMEPFNDCYHVIGQNGATVHRKGGKFMASTDFEPETACRILETTRGSDFVNFVHCTDDSYYIKERNEKSLPFESRILTPCSVRADMEQALRADELRCCKIVYFGELDRLFRLKDELLERFEGRIEAFISDKDCLDVMPVNVSKGAGLSLFMNELGLRPHEVACIGDSFNDLSMFAATEHSFAMSGSHPDIQKQATEVVDSVAEAVERIAAYNRSCVGG